MHTPGPWVQFADQGKTVAIMPAMRAGDVCAFSKPPTDDDARLMTAAPDMLEALWACRAMVGHPDNIAFIDAAIAKATGADQKE